MAWTSPRTWVANVTAITASALNTDLRDNLNYIRDWLGGTVTGVGVKLRGDPQTQLTLDRAGGTVNRLRLFVGDGSTLDGIATTSDDAYIWLQNTALSVVSNSQGTLLKVNTTGKLTGLGFYDSGEVTVSAGATQGFTHGLGAQPRFLAVYFGSAGNTTNVATPAFISVGATVRYGANDSTTISVTNNHGSSWVVRVYAME